MNPRFSLRALPLAAACVLAFAPHEAMAQTGTIIGQVLDPSGAAVAGATVSATAVSTGIAHRVTTSSAGVYSFAALPPAVYTVVVEASGFQGVTRNEVTLNVAATLPVNFKLSVAGSNTSVDVSGTATAPVETDSFQLSTVINSQQIQDLPLILRDPYQLTLLSPGVVTASNNVGGFSVNGQRDRNNNFMLDGADNNDTSVPGIAGGISSANPDSTQEFRVITNNFDAEFGRNTGAVIDVITRSGTNALHGDLYEFGRYTATGARDYFNRKSDGKQDPYVRNDFGASVGGPIWKDHTFFFLNGEVQRFRTTRTASQTTPTAAFKTGVFDYTDPFGGTVTHVDLNTPNPNNTSGLRKDPTVAKILAIAPVGQQDGGDGVTTTYQFPSGDALNDYTLTGNFAHNINSRETVNVRYTYAHSAETDPFHDESLPGLGATSNISTSHNGVVSLASQLSASTANLVRGSYNQSNTGFFCAHAGIDGITGVDAFGNGRDILIPGFFNGNQFGCYDLGDSNGQARLSSTILFADTLSKTRGRHSIKVGGEFRSVKDNSFDNFSSRNLLSLNVYDNTNANAYAFADPDPNSVGLPTFENLVWGAQGAVGQSQENQFFTRNGIRRASDLTRFRQHEWAVFGQDTWKVTPRLTAILGLRYGFNGVPYEKDGNFSNFFGNSSAVLPEGGAFTFTPVGPGTGRQLYKDSYGLIEPRVGFSYDVNGDGKTAVRGGFGIFHDRIFDNLFGNSRSNPPSQATFNAFPFSLTAPLTSPTATTAAFPDALVPSASVRNLDFFASAVVIDSNLKMPTSQSYNIGIQRQISPRATFEINYVGNHSTHVLREIDGNPPQPSLVAARLAAGVSAAALQRTALYTSATAGAVNNTAFFHTFLQESIASSNYNAVQTRVQGQIGTLNLTGSYTYGHTLDNGSDPLVPGAGGSGFPRSSFDLLPEYGNSDFDVRHRGTVAANYSLPIGLGKRFLNTGFAGRVLEGIEISGIQQVQTGLPFDLRGTRDNLHTSLNNRPQMVGAPYPANRGRKVSTGVITGVSKAAFQNPAFDQVASIHRNTFHGPGYVNTDVVFQKTQTIREAVKVVLRAESYNVLNHPNFKSPASGTISSPLFGISTSQVGQNDGTTGARQLQGAVKLIF